MELEWGDRIKDHERIKRRFAERAERHLFLHFKYTRAGATLGCPRARPARGRLSALEKKPPSGSRSTPLVAIVEAYGDTGAVTVAMGGSTLSPSRPIRSDVDEAAECPRRNPEAVGQHVWLGRGLHE